MTITRRILKLIGLAPYRQAVALALRLAQAERQVRQYEAGLVAARMEISRLAAQLKQQSDDRKMK